MQPSQHSHSFKIYSILDGARRTTLQLIHIDFYTSSYSYSCKLAQVDMLDPWRPPYCNTMRGCTPECYVILLERLQLR